MTVAVACDKGVVADPARFIAAGAGGVFAGHVWLADWQGIPPSQAFQKKVAEVFFHLAKVAIDAGHPRCAGRFVADGDSSRQDSWQRPVRPSHMEEVLGGDCGIS